MPRIEPADLDRIAEQARRRAALEDGTSQVQITVHMGTCGISAGAQIVLDALRGAIQEAKAEGVALTTSGCAGLCSQEPMVTIKRRGGEPVKYAHLDADKARRIFTEHVLGGHPVPEWALCSGSEREAVDGLTARDTAKEAAPAGIPAMDQYGFFAKQRLIVLRNRGLIDPESIEDYIGRGGYQALRKAITTMSPEQIIEEVKASGLRGRGGAGFSTGVKWGLARQETATPKCVVCNADEGDPGAFMDRSIMESDPHAVIEGMVIGAFSIGASLGFVYIREEYALALKALRKALEKAREYGLLGQNILGSGFDFDIEVHRGSGAFVCGEETSLIRSIEGVLPEPRIRPPFPAHSGIHGMPTNINNVETWANIPVILNLGAKWFSSMGTEASKGTKVFSVVGNVVNSGLVEVPMGITLREIIFDIGGGIPNGKAFKAVQTGGPSGGCIPESCLDLPVDYDNLREVGTIMGSGGMIVMDEDTCVVDIARFFLVFSSDESCGKCISCRDGGAAILHILERICAGKGQEEDLTLLEDLSSAVSCASLCGLGQTLPNPVLTTLRYFRDEYVAHIRDKRCPAGVCKALIRFTVVPDACTGCTLCARACPVKCISGSPRQVHVIDQAACIKCGQCFDVCKFKAVNKG